MEIEEQRRSDVNDPLRNEKYIYYFPVPNEVFIQDILSQLNITDICALSRTCKRHYEIISNLICYKNWKQFMLNNREKINVVVFSDFVKKDEHLLTFLLNVAKDLTLMLYAGAAANNFHIVHYALARMLNKILERAVKNGPVEANEDHIVYYWNGDKDKKFQNALEHAARNGHVEMVEKLMSIAKTNGMKLDIDRILIWAAYSGNLKLIEICLHSGATQLDKAMNIAASQKHMRVIEMLIEKGATKWESGIYGAMKADDVSLIEFFLAKGCDNWNKLMLLATSLKSLKWVQFFINKGANDMVGGMFQAIQFHSLELVEYFETYYIVVVGTEYFLDSAIRAKDDILVGHFVHRLNGFIEHHNWDNQMSLAARVDKLEYVHLFASYGASNFDATMNHAIRTKNMPIIEFCIEQGANNWNNAIAIARIFHYSDMINYFQNKKKESAKENEPSKKKKEKEKRKRNQKMK